LLKSTAALFHRSVFKRPPTPGQRLFSQGAGQTCLLGWLLRQRRWRTTAIGKKIPNSRNGQIPHGFAQAPEGGSPTTTSHGGRLSEHD
jgi:hypothetical protein